ncbi:PGPGW domain-containing protein [Caldovatus aquaticus]|uniref:PGPGW domain-containing protein n=1 Tax=Caldovatus aquaticus TaxID=2865671 RepID=A0ABS7F7F2_9PROT|nr:PGPGW domain-containing protein [Caldovatus aquaticus]MBW8271384.1 PGPGW domain-containing protein [Caldovatus aquaticus]
MMEYRPSLRRKVFGWSLLGLGVLGSVLPVLQGALFIALGLFVLRHQYHWAHRGMAWAQARWPRQVEAVEALEARLVRRVRRWQAQARALLSGRA